MNASLGIIAGLATAVALAAVFGAFDVLRTAKVLSRVASRSETKMLVKQQRFTRTQLAIVGGLLGVCLMLKFGITACIAVGVGVFVGSFALRSWRRSRAIATYERQIPLALDSIARSLRSGAGLRVSLAEVSITGAMSPGADFVRVARESEAGVPLVEALDAWAERRQMRSVRLCASALGLAIEAGSSQANAVEAISATLRQQLRANDSVKTSATEARVSAGLLVALPVAVSGFVLTTNAGARAFMFHTIAGTGVLVVGIGLDLAGALWMKRMTQRAMQ